MTINDLDASITHLTISANALDDYIPKDILNEDQVKARKAHKDYRDAFEHNVPKELLSNFHNDDQVKAYGKAMKELIDYAMEVNHFAKINAFEHYAPHEITLKFHNGDIDEADRKLSELSYPLALIMDMKHWEQANAYLKGVPIDYAMEIDHFEKRDAFENHVPKGLLYKFHNYDQVKAFGKAMEVIADLVNQTYHFAEKNSLDLYKDNLAEAFKTVEVIPDMKHWEQARAYLKGAPIDYAMEIDHFEKRDAFENNIPKELLHKFNDDKQVKAYGKAFEALDQQALELIPDMNREQARAYLKTVSLDCAMELGGDEYNDADNSCLEKLEYITYENLGEFIGCMGKSFLQGVSYDQYSEYFSSWWNG